MNSSQNNLTWNCTETNTGCKTIARRKIKIEEHFASTIIPQIF